MAVAMSASCLALFSATKTWVDLYSVRVMENMATIRMDMSATTVTTMMRAMALRRLSHAEENCDAFIGVILWF